MMKTDEIIRKGAIVLAAAAVLRLLCTGIMGNSFALFSQPQLASFLITAESGRVPSETTPPPETTVPPETTLPPETTAPTEPEEPEVALPEEPAVFTDADIPFVEMTYGTKLRPDVEKLLLQPLKWDLTGDEPSILIVHTHSTEAYTQTADRQYEPMGGYYTTDDRYNVISLGDELERLLEEAGLNVIHDRSNYELGDFNNAYDYSRKGVQDHLKEHPSIQMVIDLHRDAAQYADGTEWATSATVDGEPSAQVMFVVGSSGTGLHHPNWETNLSIAEKLKVQMDRIAPGVARPINLRAARFNHDLAMGALIAEIGSAGNTHEEAMRAIPVLAETIIALTKGAN